MKKRINSRQNYYDFCRKHTDTMVLGKLFLGVKNNIGKHYQYRIDELLSNGIENCNDIRWTHRAMCTRAVWCMNKYNPSIGDIIKEYYRRLYSFKSVIRAKTYALIKKGELTKKDYCEHCNNTERLLIHHMDDTDPYNIKTLCPKCHKKWHKNNPIKRCLG